MMRSAAMPAARAAASRAASSAATSATTSAYSRPRVHVAPTARGCASGRRRRPPRATTPAERRIVGQRADVVDDRRAEVERALGDRRPCRCRSKSGTRDAAAQPLEHRRDAPPLLVGVERRRARARGLAADVEEVGAVAPPSARASAIATSGSNRTPPSANESGVTLTMPMTSVRGAEVEHAAVGKRNREVRRRISEVRSQK